MGRLSRLAALAFVSLALVGGCTEELYEPNVLFFGEWIDIDGRDRSPEETCGGTFAYVDAYAGAVAAEFGVSEHLGAYRWYSPEQYAVELPCDDINYSCASTDGVAHSWALPIEHEVAHLANFIAGICPDALGEGLAEVYSANAFDAKTHDFELLVARMQEPSIPPSDREYGILGRFAAYLVARFGLEAVLDVCRTTGSSPSGPQLSAAMESVLGVSTDELLTDFEPELGSCNRARDYRWRVFGCGVAEAAPDLGRVSLDSERSIETTFALDCANDTTIGPLGDMVWTAGRFDVGADGIYMLSVDGDGLDISEVELRLTHCEPCGNALILPGEIVGPEILDAGRYSLELHAPADFRGSVRVTLEP
ncbi:hypothetical protein ENSA5_02940 [Enhygromyxa salina]|uniref:Lipoprotein n=1 Tax=Enhygromyxa salina TaxID=215803 RepID=A0A2S9YJM6_9BACT|nr:hypothetical protein [Enhygromyxa salina]PRQ05304.1 hypothetical protein ENSA5_02940 [Enhygromyxa salina]